MTEVVLATSVIEVVQVASSSTTVELSRGRGVQGASGVAGPPGVVPVFSVIGNVFVTAGTHRFYVERAGTLAKVRASVGTPPLGSSLTVAVKVNGTTAATASITAGSFTGTATASLALVAGDYLTVDVTAVGSTTSGADLTVSASIE